MGTSRMARGPTKKFAAWHEQRFVLLVLNVPRNGSVRPRHKSEAILVDPRRSGFPEAVRAPASRGIRQRGSLVGVSGLSCNDELRDNCARRSGLPEPAATLRDGMESVGQWGGRRVLRAGCSEVGAVLAHGELIGGTLRPAVRSLLIFWSCMLPHESFIRLGAARLGLAGSCPVP